MIGAIIGDVIGSVYEWKNQKSTDIALFSRFTRFTDDSVMTVAIADAILNKQTFSNIKLIDYYKSRRLYADKLKEYARKFPGAGYGQMFEKWAYSDSFKPYNSCGNGSAMRVSPIGFAFDNIEDVLREAKKSAEVTHNHREGIKGAQAVASAVFLAYHGETKETIREFIIEKFKYNLNRSLDEIRPTYTFDPTCQGSVPEAIIAFLESNNFEDAIRKAISIGGDSDTIACIAGGIAQAYYKKIPPEIVTRVRLMLDQSLKKKIDLFNKAYNITF